MAGVGGKSAAPFSVIKRSLSLRSVLSGGRRSAREGRLVTRSPHPLRTYRHPAYVCFSYQDSMSETLRTCYAYLNQTSRSFAAVIQALDGELR